MNSDSDDKPAPDCVNEEPAAYGAKALHASLAPDGLPWPEGYFDCKLRVTLEEAIVRNGVRPSRYHFGRPVYTQKDRDNPNYRFPLPPEPEWTAEADRRANARVQ